MAQARLTWLGHSTVLVELDGVRLVTDPLLRGRILHLRRRRPLPATPVELDAVLVSHAHWDHLDLPSLAALGRELTVVCPRGLGGLLARRGFGQVVEVEAGEQARLAGVTVSATHAEHAGGRGPFQTKARALGYVVGGSRTIYFAGDTELFPGMAELAPLDVALLPVSGWGPRLGPGHLSPAEAAEALRLLEPSVAVPIHWGTYSPLFARVLPGRAPADQFAARAAQLAPGVDVRLLEPGETLEL